MNPKEIIESRNFKPKEKVEQLSTALLNKAFQLDELVVVAIAQKDVDKANCIEAIEFATRANPQLITKTAFKFVVDSLQEKAPRIKWEAAKVIANTAMYAEVDLKKAIENLLQNSSHVGTVVRWSAAQALSAIANHKLKGFKVLLPQMHEIMIREEKSSIKKIYSQALKKAGFKL